MTRPLTCLTLLAAGTAGLYLYHEKHRAAMLDREINRVVHATEQTRERTGMLRAEYALLSEPDRLAGLAAQHLALTSVTPAQFSPLADLGNRLPPVGAPTEPPAALEPPAPIAAAAPPPLLSTPADPAPVAPPAKPDLVRPEIARLAPTSAGHGVAPAVRPNALIAQAAQAHPARHERLALAKPPEERPANPVFAPVVPAFASQQPPQPIRPPTLQQASVVQPPSYTSAPPFVGSALGMGRTTLPAPVPVGGAGGPGGAFAR